MAKLLTQRNGMLSRTEKISGFHLRVSRHERELYEEFCNSEEADILREIRVDQDVSFRGFDQVNGKICCANVIEIASDFEPRKFAMPVGILSKGERARKN